MSTKTKKTENISDMQQIAQKIQYHHTQPVAEAQVLPGVFPAKVMFGLGVSLAVGAVVGLITGWLLLNNTIVIPAWEGLYSTSPITFVIFWGLMGVAAGIAIAGVSIAFIISTHAE